MSVTKVERLHNQLLLGNKRKIFVMTHGKHFGYISIPKNGNCTFPNQPRLQEQEVGVCFKKTTNKKQKKQQIICIIWDVYFLWVVNKSQIYCKYSRIQQSSSDGRGWTEACFVFFVCSSDWAESFSTQPRPGTIQQTRAAADLNEATRSISPLVLAAWMTHKLWTQVCALVYVHSYMCTHIMHPFFRETLALWSLWDGESVHLLRYFNIKRILNRIKQEQERQGAKKAANPKPVRFVQKKNMYSC